MSRPIGFMTDIKNDDAALSVDPSPESPVTEEKPTPAAEITLETLPTFPSQGSAVSARLTSTDLECPRSDPPYRNGNGVAHPEVEEGDVHDAPVPVPKRQGLPSFAQSEFYTVHTISIHPSAGPGLLTCFYSFPYFASFVFFFCYCIDCSPSTS